MKKQPLVVQLFLYSFLLIVLLLGAIGSGYYHLSSQEISRLIDQKTQDSLEQTGQFMSSYLGKLKQTSHHLATNDWLVTYVKEPTKSSQEQLLFY